MTFQEILIAIAAFAVISGITFAWYKEVLRQRGYKEKEGILDIENPEEHP